LEKIGLEAVLLMDSFRRGVKEYLSGTQQMMSETEQLTRELQPAGVALAALGAAGMATIRSATLTAARTEELGLVLDVLAENARKAAVAEGDLARAETLTTQAVDGTIAAVKERGITTQVALKLTSQFARYELDMAQASDLARVAQDAAVISMQDSSEALDGLLHGILTYNPRVLRTYGITTQAEDAFKAFAAANGLAADELTNTQRAQAMLNAVLKEGQSISGAYEAAMGSAGKQLRSINRYWEEAKNALGEAFLPMLSKAVGALTDLLKWFNELEPAQQKTIAYALGIGTAFASVAGAAILLAPRIIATAQAFGILYKFSGDVGAGLSLLRAGFSATEVASLGLAGKLAVLLPILLAVVAAVYAAYKAYELHREVQEREIEVTDAWTKFLKDQVAAGKNAVEIADEYAKAQQRVAQAHESGGLIAEMFVDKERALNAETKQLSHTLIETSESYEQYAQAVASVNASLEDGEKALTLMSRQTYEATKLGSAYSDAGVKALQLASATQEVGDQTVTAADQMSKMVDALQRVGIAGTQAENVQRAIALATGQMTQLATTQEDALTLLALAYEQGDLDQEKYIEAATKVLAVTQDSEKGYEAVRGVVERMTGGLYELGDSLEGIPTSMQDAASASRQMAEILEQAAQEEADIAKRVVDMEAGYNRQIIDININRARAIEDIDRNLTQQRAQAAAQLSQRMAQIEAQGAQQQQQAAQQHAQQMAQIEEQHQERIRDIKKRYQESMYEAVANRDATAALEAMRTRDDELEEAGRDRDKQQADAQESYARQQEEQRVNLETQRQQAQEAYSQQMADLALSRQQQIGELDLSIQHQMEDMQRHNQWEIEAMRNKFSTEYTDAVNAYASEESAYRQHLVNMQTIYAQYGGGGYGPARPAGYTGRWATGGAFVASGPTQATFGEAGVPELVVAQPLSPVAGMGMGAGTNVSGTMRHDVQGSVEGVMSGFEGRLTGAISQAVLRAFGEVLR